MVKRALNLNFKKLWIILLLTFLTQGLWITLNAEATEAIIDKKIYKEDNCLKIDVNIPFIEGSYGEKANTKIANYTNGWIMDVSQELQKFKEEGYICNNPYELMAKYNIFRNDQNLLSFYIDYYQFTGGAHGMTYRIPYNIDKKTGDFIKLNELFRNSYDYKSKIDSIIREEISKTKDTYFDGPDGFKGVNENTTFYIDNDNLIIYFALYEIAPYSSGIPEFKIDLNNFKDGLIYGKI